MFDAYLKWLQTGEPAIVAPGHVTVPYNETNHGIISYLTKMIHNNIYDKKLIDITVSSSGDERYGISCIVDKNERHQFITKNISDEWILIDFRNIQLVITDYSLKCYKKLFRNYSMTSWTVYGSIDGNNFEILDERRNDMSLKVSKVNVLFKMSKIMKIRYLKFQATNTESGMKTALTINQLEFFGEIHGEIRI